MATSFPLPTLGPTVNPAGITTPSMADILRSLQESFKSIYGADVYIDPDSQDGQWMALLAQGFYDANLAIIAAYNSFSPATAVGEALSTNVKINGISRRVPTRSTATVLIVGQVGTVITEGIVEDVLGQRWTLPASVTIPPAAEILVTATAVNDGAIDATPNTITKINTPTLGWQTVTNPASAVRGQPVETDAELRIKQALSVTNPAVSVLESIQAALLNLETVTRARVYENDTGATDSNGLTEHSISAVVEGGVALEIAQVIRRKKTPGCGTYGTTSIPITDALGDTTNINFFLIAYADVKLEIEIEPSEGYVTSTADAIKQAIVDYINELGIGQKIDHGRLFLPAQLFGTDERYRTFEVNTIEIALLADTLAEDDIPIDFNEAARVIASNITITVAP